MINWKPSLTALSSIIATFFIVHFMHAICFFLNACYALTAQIKTIMNYKLWNNCRSSILYPSFASRICIFTQNFTRQWLVSWCLFQVFHLLLLLRLSPALSLASRSPILAPVPAVNGASRSLRTQRSAPQTFFASRLASSGRGAQRTGHKAGGEVGVQLSGQRLSSNRSNSDCAHETAERERERRWKEKRKKRETKASLVNKKKNRVYSSPKYTKSKHKGSTVNVLWVSLKRHRDITLVLLNKKIN